LTKVRNELMAVGRPRKRESHQDWNY